MKRLNKKKAFSHKDQRQDESTTWYFIPDKIILSGCTFVINYRLEDNMIKMEQYKQNIPMELRSEEHTSELQSRQYLVCRLLLEKKKTLQITARHCMLQLHSNQT